MIGVDTNVLVRVLVADDARQVAVVQRLLARVEDEGATVFVPTIVVVETVWVLRSVYRLTRSEIVAHLTTVLMSDQVLIEDADVIERALRTFELGRADFADYLAREAALVAGAQALLTFDRAAQTEDGFLDPDPRRWPKDIALHEATPRYARRRHVATTA